MNNNQIINFLTIILAIMIGILFFLSLVFLILKLKDVKQKKRH